MALGLIDVVNLHYAYPDGTEALRGLNLHLHSSQRLALVGANGSGKSTLLLHLAGCLAAPDGVIFLEGQSVGRQTGKLQSAVGLIFQNPDDQLFMPTVLEDVAFGLVARGMAPEEADQQALEVLKRLEADNLKDRTPHRLSGGEKRTVALAGILVMEPRLVVLDEPSAALDPRARKRAMEELLRLDTPFLLATHDLDMALELCDTAAVVSKGVIAAEGSIDLLCNAELLRSFDLEPPLRFGPVLSR